jgi:preprotein translocase subunit YajC
VDFLILLLLMFGVFWFAVIMPQRRRANQQKSMIENLKPGDYIVTAGGMYGTITEIGDDDLGLEIAPDIEVRVAKRAVGALIPPEEIEDVVVGDDAAETPLAGDAVAQETDAADEQPVEEKRR